MKRSRAFSMLESMVVLAMIGIVLTVATSTYVALMRHANRGRFMLQAMQSTRTVLDVVLEYGRRAGGRDLPAHARVLVDKSGGQRGTDLLWIIEQAGGYGTCGVVGISGARIDLPVLEINGEPRCCFEAGEAPAGTPALADPVAAGPAFRRTAVVGDSAGRFLPVFLYGDPTPEACFVSWAPLPGIERVIRPERANVPDFTDSTIVLADVRRIYIDYDAEGVRPPFGALFSQVEVDGDVDVFVGERQRISSNAIDLRVAVGYDAPVPEDELEVVEVDDDDALADADGDEEGDEDEEEDDEPEVAPGSSPLLEMLGDPRGWRLEPLPVTAAGALAPPVMLGVAVSTAARGDAPTQSPLPWSVRPLEIARPANVFPLVGRVAFRNGASP
jgi:prepilin-type N-terminal cleavage/methylation domain-containing protein